ncbi:MAG: hypothetical protein CR982_10785 [Candidatus Cloacimonadota bacterium]|nr:MAG: hypothetical protein CR982_10785 [Candidatus Cloacimonadota bacterium]PIE78960.1 MAG: hypothetical protein CSA15_05110 [Candidatus Delongbacteria bacterium]
MKEQKNKTDFKKYLSEGLLIVFSVLFALFINKTYQDAKTNSYRDNALKQIKTELIGNQNTLKEWMANHNAIIKNLNNLIENKKDNIQKLAETKGYLPQQMIFDNMSLVNKPLLNSAWTSAQSIGIISEFDFKTLQYINATYELQQLMMNTTVKNIAEILYSKSTDVENIKGFLIELRLRFGNLKGQEYSLEELYKKTIEVLQ